MPTVQEESGVSDDAGGAAVSENRTACGNHDVSKRLKRNRCICPELAAAEERGRLAGREEAAKIVESYTNILAIDHVAARIRADK